MKTNYHDELVKPGVVVLGGHVQGLSLTRSLGKKGIPVIVIDKENCISRFSRYCLKFMYCPDYFSEEFVLFLIYLAKKEDLKKWILLPTNDHAVYSISKERKILSEYYNIITPNMEIINKIYDKKNLLNLSSSIGIDIPKTHYPGRSNLDIKELNYPIIIKGINGMNFYQCFKKKAFYCSSYNELEENIRFIAKYFPISQIFIQEVIPHRCEDIVSYTSFSINGAVKSFWMGNKVREHPIEFGTATFAESCFDGNLQKMGAHLINALDYTGVSEIEFIKDRRDNKYKLIEMNARTWLWVDLAIQCGINYSQMIYCYLNELPLTQKTAYNIGVKWFNIWTDLPYSLSLIAKSKLSIKEFFESYKGIKHEATWDKGDFLPFVMYLILIPYFMKRR